MAKNSKFVNPVAAAVGVAFVSSLAASSNVVADDNPFSTADLDAGYQLAGEKGEEGNAAKASAATIRAKKAPAAKKALKAPAARKALKVPVAKKA